MIIPGSRWSNENDGCATVSRRTCEGGSYQYLTFDDNYSNYYQWRDLKECQESCFNVGERVMIKRGSRYASETSQCATLTERICDEDWYKRITFDDGYRNWYQHRDLDQCTASASSASVSSKKADTRNASKSRYWRHKKRMFNRMNKRKNKKILKNRQQERRWRKNGGNQEAQSWLKSAGHDLLEAFGLDNDLSQEKVAKAYRRKQYQSAVLI